MIVPSATYRLQLNKDFNFGDAKALVPYLDQLGISHAYLSPILRARPGSTHGYDTVDHTTINPELGTLDDFRALAHALRQRGMGIILDFVPNHMGVGGADNALWLDVLKHGPASRYAEWFDIDWHPPVSGIDGKVLLPFLGASYADALVAGDLALRIDGGGLAVWAYGEHKCPIQPQDVTMLVERHGSLEAVLAAHTGIAGETGSWAMLDSLIGSQHWRLAHFAVASDDINYRRFFINSDLAGIRIERPEVFDHAHALIFSLIADGLVDGLRIDHVDGLLDPKAYLDRVRAMSPRPIYLVVEKILAPHEYLRPDWPVDGTTGYEVGAQLTRVLMAPSAELPVTDAYAEFVGETVAPDEEEYRCKRRVMDNELAAELTALTRIVAGLASSVRATRDLTQSSLRRGLREIIAHCAVYRTYIDKASPSARDRREIARAIILARRSQPHLQPAVFDFLEALLTGRLGPEYDARQVTLAIGRFQQYTGPVMAKGLEDTALYRYNRLVALNEVGAHPDRFSISVAAFHDANRRRLQFHPHCMVATSTHDTKRGEDTRVLIAALADEPELWSNALRMWTAELEGAATIHRNDFYLFFQLLVGGWPIDGQPDDLGERISGAMVKSIREARQRSDWAVPDSGYERAISQFVSDALGNETFLAGFHSTRDGLVSAGRRRGLIQTALKLTIPGVPDIYRGAEDWEQSFVDPDNRRAIDFSDFAERLRNPSHMSDEKLQLTQALLRLRRQKPLLFSNGTYEPLDLGPGVVAFRRRHEDDELVVMARVSDRSQALPVHSYRHLGIFTADDDGTYQVMASG